MASTAAGDSTGSSQQRWKSKLSAWAQPRMVSGASNGTIEFSWKRCLTMLTLHVFAPFSTPVGLYLIGIPAMKRSQLLPTSFGAFTNTVGLIMILHTLELVCLVAGLADFVLSIVSTCYLLWFGRQLMIASTCVVVWRIAASITRANREFSVQSSMGTSQMSVASMLGVGVKLCG